MIDRLLDKITAHPIEKRNMRALSLSSMIRSADMNLFGGTELQAFQVKIGLTTSQIGLVSATGQIASAISYLCLMGVADRIDNRARVYSLLITAMAIFPALLAGLSLAPAGLRRPAVAMPIMLAGGTLEAVLISFMALVFSALFVRSISPRIQGKFMGIMGAGAALLGLTLGAISSNALLYLSYPNGFTVAFIMAMCLLLLAARVVNGATEIPELSTREKPNSILPVEAFKGVIKTKEFKLLLFPNILRGLSGGASYFAMAVGMKQLGLGVEYAGYTTMLVFAGGLIGTASIGITVDRFGPGRVLLISSTGMAVALVGIAISHAPWVFLLFFFIMFIAASCEGTTIPLAHYAIVPQRIIGAFSAVRLMLLAGTSATSVVIDGFLLDKCGAIWVFGISAAIYVTTGILWLHAFNEGRKPSAVIAVPQSKA